MAPTGNGRSDVKTWLQFTIRLVTLVVMLGGGLAALYARLCVVETKVEAVMERLASLEAKMDAAKTAKKTAMTRAR